MKKSTAREWTALCKTCNWSGKRTSDQDKAEQEMHGHLKTHPQHRARVMVTGEDSSAIDEKEKNRVEEAWNMLNKREG